MQGVFFYVPKESALGLYADGVRFGGAGWPVAGRGIFLPLLWLCRDHCRGMHVQETVRGELMHIAQKADKQMTVENEQVIYSAGKRKLRR